MQVTTKKLNALELKLLEFRHNYTLMLSRLRQDSSSKLERGSGVGAEKPNLIDSMLASQLPRPALNYLEKFSHQVFTESLPKPESSSDPTLFDNNQVKFYFFLIWLYY